MKTYLCLVSLALATATIDCTHVLLQGHKLRQHSLTNEITKRACRVNIEEFVRCKAENGLQDVVVLFRNCLQQARFYQTYHQLTNFLCKTRTEQEYAKFLNCMDDALETEIRNNPKVLPVVEQCLRKEENNNSGLEHPTYEKYVI
ncbi:uncharacterized protein [Centruroides vittatus]|uniref:uncharacterized protein n=1 Tax=Centruroides vittatus TaxID=120091 RepID=UPI00351080DD